ncbi:MAG: M1 family metallopeptidase [Tissierella sp.]|nr:M1 family metallopeptidase [Tissierella sp.]
MDRRAKLFLLLIVFTLIFSGCKKEEVVASDTLIHKDLNGIEMELLNQYDIEVELDYENKTYTGKQWVTYVNNTDKTLGEIFFHIYPNAFKTLDTLPILFKDNIEDPLSYDNGYIQLNIISRDNKELEYKIIGEDSTTLSIKLDQPLIQGQKAKIYMEYDVKLPSPMDRFGYGKKTINLGNWYPIACVYDEDGWNLDPYYSIGDPFYSDLANYNVSIKTEKDVVIASSGNIISEVIEDDEKVYEIEGLLIRDFALVASKEFKVAEESVEGTTIKLYYLDEKSNMVKKSLEYSKQSLEVFNRLYGKYPYGVYSVVMTEFPSGMEYPGIVFISEEYFRYQVVDLLERVIVHETAHQWWYGLVGNNQIDEPWLDEALATYSETIYYKEIYGEEMGKEYFDYNVKLGYEYGVQYLLGKNMIYQSLSDFYGWDDYGILVYTKGALFIDEIKEMYGTEVLYKILNTYFNEYKFYNATTKDFIDICERVTKSNFSPLVDKWLY